MLSKMQALEYLIINEHANDEWAEAGMYNALKTVILSDDDIFSLEYLDQLLHAAEEF